MVSHKYFINTYGTKSENFQNFLLYKSILQLIKKIYSSKIPPAVLGLEEIGGTGLN